MGKSTPRSPFSPTPKEWQETGPAGRSHGRAQEQQRVAGQPAVHEELIEMCWERRKTALRDEAAETDRSKCTRLKGWTANAKCSKGRGDLTAFALSARFGNSSLVPTARRERPKEKIHGDTYPICTFWARRSGVTIFSHSNQQRENKTLVEGYVDARIAKERFETSRHRAHDPQLTPLDPSAPSPLLPR